MPTRGEEADDRALSFLEAQGLTLIERNWSCRAGDLDLVMRDGGAMVIAEVRARGRGDFGSAAESVAARKQRRIVTATQLWLAQRPQWVEAPVRFDIVALDG